MAGVWKRKKKRRRDVLLTPKKNVISFCVEDCREMGKGRHVAATTQGVSGTRIAIIITSTPREVREERNEVR